MASFRDQRLNNDYKELLWVQQQLNHGRHTKLQVRPEGRPPYQSFNLTFHCAGYIDDMGTVRQRHQLFLEFPKACPLEAPPTFKRVSPLFHPNIYPHGVFCLGFEGDRKWRPTISLESLVLHVSRLIRFDPEWVNLDPPASRTSQFWEEYMKKFTFPADTDPFVIGEALNEVVPRPIEAPAARPPPPPTRPSIRIEPGHVRPQPGMRIVQSAETRRRLGPIRINRNNPNA